jgi:serine/threonine protein kinase
VNSTNEIAVADLLVKQAELWAQGECVSVESLLAAHPSLAGDPDSQLDLIYHEVLLRTGRGEQPQLAEYQQRFPQFAEALRLQFEVHEVIDQDLGRLGDTRGNPASTATHRPRRDPGERELPMIAGYEVIDEIGHGGMGVVYRARQVGLDRIVAIKMIRGESWDSHAEQSRLRTEAELVARLQHPNITQVYEVGEHDGSPYFSLEYVDGGRLADYLAGRPQEARHAAAWVETIARAVHYAHQRGVVHRDLKPANILLEDSGFGVQGSGDSKDAADSRSALNPEPRTLTPKITDFGLAKRLDPGVSQTQSGALIGTPQYMAPEQAAGQAHALGPATDVHALGVILYEMVTGRPPFGAASVIETLDAVRNQEPVPPRRLVPRLARDIETICLKCLQKSPAARYASAADLADDLRRFLSHEPILARPVGPAVRLLRWGRRKPLVAALSASLAAALAIGVAAVMWQWQRAERNYLAAESHRREAERNFQKTWAAVDRYFTQVSETRLLDVPGLEPLRKELLESALRFYREFIDQRGDDARLKAELAMSYQRAGVMTSMIGSKQDALRLFDQARALAAAIVDEDPTNLAVAAELARTEFHQGNVLMAIGRPADALELLQQSRARWLALHTQHHDRGDFQAGLASCLIDLALVQQARDADSESVLATVDSARQLLEPLSESHGDVAVYRAELARALGTIGNVHAADRRYGDALAAHQRALEMRLKLVDKHPHVTAYQASLARTYANLGSLERLSGRPADEAVRSFELACNLFDNLTRAHPTVNEFQADLARSYGNLGIAQSAARRPADVLASYQRGHEIRKRLVAANPDVTQFREELARDHNNLGTVYSAMKQPADALEHHEAALQIYLSLVRASSDRGASETAPTPAYASYLGLTLNNKALAIEKLGRIEAALPCFVEAIAYQRSAFERAPNNPQFREYLSNHIGNLAAFHRRQGQHAEAARTAQERKQLWPTHAAQLYNSACEFALCVPLVDRDRSPAPEDQAVRDRYTRLAVDAFRDAVAAGYNNLKLAQEDKDLDPIRSHPEFQALLGQVSSGGAKQ